MVGASGADAGEHRGRAEGDLCGGTPGGGGEAVSGPGRVALPPSVPPVSPSTGSASFPRPLPALGGVCPRSGDGGADVSGSGCRAAAAPPGPEPRGEPGPPPSPAMPAGSTEPDGILSYQVGGARGGYPVRPEDAPWLLTAAFPAAEEVGGVRDRGHAGRLLGWGQSICQQGCVIGLQWGCNVFARDGESICKMRHKE